MPAPPPLVINGWTIFVHPLFLDQLEALIAKVDEAKKKDPTNYRKKNAAKRLAAIATLIFKVIPEDPESSEYRQGDTLGNSRRHWLRAKFYQQYRLFFRYRTEGKLLVFAWVNDDGTLRAYGSKSDAYAVFSKMLNKGHPPDSLDALLKECRAEADRMNQVVRALEAEKS
jgi:toxin YhaV